VHFDGDRFVFDPVAQVQPLEDQVELGG